MDKGSIIVIVLGLAVVAAVAVFALSRRSQPVMLPPATTYSNLEVYDISWNDDGLPVRVAIHREAKQTHA